MIDKQYPTTPDGRYFVVRGRLWRTSNPSLDPATRAQLVHDLMTARSAKGRAIRTKDSAAREGARQAVDQAKHALGERGSPWWTDGAPDWNRHLVRNTPTPPGTPNSNPFLCRRHQPCRLELYKARLGQIPSSPKIP